MKKEEGETLGGEDDVLKEDKDEMNLDLEALSKEEAEVAAVIYMTKQYVYIDHAFT